MNESILNGIFIFSILQALLFALLSLTKKSKSLPDVLIGIWLFLLAIQTILIFCIHNSLLHGILSYLPIIITLLYGPLQYLYVYKIGSGSTKINMPELVHLIPFLFFLITSITYQASGVYIKILAGTSSMLGLTYCLLTIFLLRKHSVNIRNHFSYTEKVNLSWLYKLVYGLFIIWSGVVVLVFLRRIFNINISLDWFYSAIPFFIFYLGYHGIKQQVIYSFNSDIPDHSPVNQEKSDSKTEGYKKSGLRQNQMQRIHEKMLLAMQSEKLFLNPMLSLQELSEKLNIPTHHITQTLNEFVSQNFYDFVNSYRVNEFKIRVDKGDAGNFSLLGIAFDCGFNSKSSFNRIFKTTTGLTPSDYRNKLA